MVDPVTKKIHLAYKNMRSRCENPRHVGYKNYGGRGITVCQEWIDSRDAFVQWAIAAGHAMDLSLDRIDTNAGYSPANCRWADVRTQLRNQRRNARITHEGVTLTRSEWAERLGVGQDTLYRRIEVYGMPLGKAMTEGSLRFWSHGTRQGYEAHKCRCDECRASNAARHRARRAARRQVAQTGHDA